MRRWWWVGVLVVACAKKPGPDEPLGRPAAILEAARARPVPDPVQARFNLRVRSDLLEVAGSTAGAMVIDRPGSGRIEIVGPVGIRIATLAADGERLDLLLFRDEKHLFAEKADEVLRETTGGVAGLDDLLAVLVGDLPFDQADPQSLEETPEGVRVRLEGPFATRIEVWIDPVRGTPARVEAHNQDGDLLLSAVYDTYEELEDRLVPTAVEVWVPSIDLLVELRYRGWKALDVEPGVFSLEVPDRWATIPLEEALEQLTPPRVAP